VSGYRHGYQGIELVDWPKGLSANLAAIRRKGMKAFSLTMIFWVQLGMRVVSRMRLSSVSWNGESN
jgi:hypothetical protein